MGNQERFKYSIIYMNLIIQLNRSSYCDFLLNEPNKKSEIHSQVAPWFISQNCQSHNSDHWKMKDKQTESSQIWALSPQRMMMTMSCLFLSNSPENHFQAFYKTRKGHHPLISSCRRGLILMNYIATFAGSNRTHKNIYGIPHILWDFLK